MCSSVCCHGRLSSRTCVKIPRCRTLEIDPPINIESSRETFVADCCSCDWWNEEELLPDPTDTLLVFCCESIALTVLSLLLHGSLRCVVHYVHRQHEHPNGVSCHQDRGGRKKPHCLKKNTQRTLWIRTSCHEKYKRFIPLYVHICLCRLYIYKTSHVLYDMDKSHAEALSSLLCDTVPIF